MSPFTGLWHHAGKRMKFFILLLFNHTKQKRRTIALLFQFQVMIYSINTKTQNMMTLNLHFLVLCKINYNRSSNADGRIGSDYNTDKHRKYKPANHIASEKEDGKQHEEDGE
jgi:hypothetical protein